jgi:tetratricopeptide (TPR) repeat protein
MKIHLLLSFVLVSVSCSRYSDCPEGINLLPMFGNLVKCPEQLEADKTFIATMDKDFDGDRKKAAEDRVARAWDFYHQRDEKTAMKRFNQAWLLDSTNADVYWGFGSLIGNQKNEEEALLMFKKSLRLNPGNDIVWASAGQAHGSIYMKGGDSTNLDSCIYYFGRSYDINPSNGKATSGLTIAYTEAMEADSAKKYLAITDKIDPKLVSGEIRKAIRKMK